DGSQGGGQSRAARARTAGTSGIAQSQLPTVSSSPFVSASPRVAAGSKITDCKSTIAPTKTGSGGSVAGREKEPAPPTPLAPPSCSGSTIHGGATSRLPPAKG